MGRHGDRKRLRHEHHRERSSEFSLANALHSVKRRRLSDDAPKEDLRQQDNNGFSINVRDDDGWQTVTSKSARRSKKYESHSSNRGSTYPTLSYSHKITKALMIEDLRDLALYILADGTAPSWVAVAHSRAVSKVVIVMVPGLDDDARERGKVLTSGSREAVNHKPEAGIETGNSHAGEQASDGIEDSDQNGSHDDLLLRNVEGSITTKPVDLQNSSNITRIQHDWLFNDVLPVRAPGDSKYSKVHSPLQAMLVAPEVVDKTSQKSRNDKHFKSTVTSITQFVHSTDDLREAEYPIHSAAFTSAADASLESSRRESTGQSKAAGWVDSEVSDSKPVIPAVSLMRSRNEITQGLNIYAIDCEMVLTSDQKSSLARISVVSWPDGKIVMDKYVKPDLPIENYFTQYSGITEKILQNVDTKLVDIQQELLKLLTPSTIILGHSLESDLNALKMTHPFIVDTSMLFPHPRGLPLRSSLKFLANKYLKREIQRGGANGHDSVEDARAVLDLVKLKCEKGSKFGTPEANGEPIFKRISKYSEKAGKLLTSAIVEYGSSPERGLGKDATFAIGCQNDDEITDGMLRAVNGDPDGKEIPAGGVNFIWGRLRALEFTRDWVTSHNANSNTGNDSNATHGEEGTLPEHTSNGSNGFSQADVDRDILKTIHRIDQIHEALPPTSMLIVCSGNSDVRPVLRLQAIQSQYRKEFKVKKWDELTVRWTDAEEQALRNAAEKARQGWGRVTIK